MGLFEEEEERIGIASEVVKAEGEDLGTLGSFMGDRARWHVVRHDVLLGPYLREPQDCNDSESPISIEVGLGIWEFCAISRRLISKIRFPHSISVADAICGTRFDLRDSKRRAPEN